MKKVVLFLVTILMCCACAQGTNSTKVNKYINALIEGENRLDGQTLKAYAKFNTSSFVDSDVNGILAIYDYSENDVVIAKVINDDVVIKLYTLKDENLVEVDSMTLVERYLDDGSILNFDGFVKEIDGEKYLFFESISINSFFADGLAWTFKEVGIENGKLKELASKELAGSYFDKDDISNTMDYVSNTGLEIDELSLFGGKYLIDQIKDIEKLFYIKRLVNSDFEPEDYSNSKEEVYYGDTKFKDYKINDFNE